MGCALRYDVASGELCFGGDVSGVFVIVLFVVRYQWRVVSGVLALNAERDGIQRWDFWQ